MGVGMSWDLALQNCLAREIGDRGQTPTKAWSTPTLSRFKGASHVDNGALLELPDSPPLLDDDPL